jgi:hypothetical protein
MDIDSFLNDHGLVILIVFHACHIVLYLFETIGYETLVHHVIIFECWVILEVL